MLYGPFAAEYGGGSIGAVLNITTRMPDHFEIYADALGAVQDFSQYATDHTYGTWQLAGRHRRPRWRFFLAAVGQSSGFASASRWPMSP